MSDSLMIHGYIPVPESINRLGNSTVYLACRNGVEKLVVIGDCHEFRGEPFVQDDRMYTICDVSHDNVENLRRHFTFTAPVPGTKGTFSIGLGDRLGTATPGHIRSIRKMGSVFPVFAQQSVREMSQTGRSFEDVLDSVSCSVFRLGYKTGFGADGDHIKNHADVARALACGFSMITLDTSEHIDTSVFEMTDRALLESYDIDPHLESTYLNKEFFVGKQRQPRVTRPELIRAAKAYGKAISFITETYELFIKGRNIDFEISIDESSEPTTLFQHYFIANELIRANVQFTSLAPRFPGRFEKGVDYIGNIQQFEVYLSGHVRLAESYGYKISIHSGSDKFDLFPVIWKQTDGILHLKTSGTFWLEALRLVAQENPRLYREIHQYALQVFHLANKQYHVSADIRAIANIDQISNNELPTLLDMRHSRQLLHVTYGAILTAMSPKNRNIYKDRIYDTIYMYREAYDQLIAEHLNKHLESLVSE